MERNERYEQREGRWTIKTNPDGRTNVDKKVWQHRLRIGLQSKVIERFGRKISRKIVHEDVDEDHYRLELCSIELALGKVDAR